ncbi:MAG: aspartate--tRNA ligase, partial [Flavobacteriales bacterium]|nr:aspartate--tRNA ligase [Flavobacteriales bacterium]
NTFEGMVRHLFKVVLDVEIEDFPRMDYDEAMRLYGSDKPDVRFGMKFVDLCEVTKGKGFGVFDSAETVLGIVVPGGAEYTRKKLDKLTDWVKRPQIGAKGLIYCKINEDGTTKSSVDKFFDEGAREVWAKKMSAQKGDLILVLSGDLDKTRKQLGELRLHLGSELGLCDSKVFKPLWVMDFPLLEWDEKTERYHAMHHPFTSPKPDQLSLIDTDPGKVKANAYDMVINGVEIGGGSIRIHNRELQARMFDLLGFTPKEAEAQFGFLMDAFQYGAPPHGGLALGFDRLCSMFGGSSSIRDFIAFPKNNSGRDVMIDAPSPIDDAQYSELELKTTYNPNK